MDVSSYISNPKWYLNKTEAKVNSMHYPEPYLDITFSIFLHRRNLSYWLRNIIPATFSSSLAIMTLLIPVTLLTPRVLIIAISCKILYYSTPIDLPPNSLLSSILNSHYSLILFVFTHTLLVTALTSSLMLKKISFFNKAAKAVVILTSCRKKEAKVLSEEEIMVQISRKLDMIMFVLLFLVFIICGVGNLLKIPAGWYTA